MNQTISDWKFPSWKQQGNDLQQIETCRQQSKCYLLAPPPRPPTIPELFLSMTCQSASSSSLSSLPAFTNLRSKTETSAVTFLSILLGLIIAFTSACLILILLGVKFQFHQKWRSRHRKGTDLSSVNSSIRETNSSDVAFIKTSTTTTTTNGNTGSNSSQSGDGCTSFSSVVPISYDCLTPLTNTTLAPNSYPTLRLTNPTIHSTENSTNVYEEIRPSFDRHQCRCCCSCSSANHYNQQQYASTLRQLTPHYYTCEPAPSISSTSTSIICQSCLLETLHRKQQTTSTMNCACRHFFMPIK